MNRKYRAEIVYSMDMIARTINDEDIFMRWLRSGVADGDIDYTESYESAIERLSDMDCYVGNDEFSELMGLFIRLMGKAKLDGSGLFADHVLSA